MNKVEKAIVAMRECADAVEQLPESMRRKNLFVGHLISPVQLRAEADWLDEQIDAFREAIQ